MSEMRLKAKQAEPILSLEASCLYLLPRATVYTQLSAQKKLVSYLPLTFGLCLRTSFLSRLFEFLDVSWFDPQFSSGPYA